MRFEPYEKIGIEELRMTEEKERKCIDCGNTLKSKKAIRCLRCNRIFQNKSVKIICETCGKEFVKPLCRTKDNRCKKSGRFCSQKCYGIWMSKNMEGDKNPAWLGGISKDFSKWGSRGQYRRLRYLVFKRDNYTCQICEKQKDLNIHHVIPYKISKNNDLENLITICRSCHSKEDWKWRR